MAIEYIHREHVEAAEAVAFEALKAELFDLPGKLAARLEGRPGGEVETVVRAALHDAIGRFERDMLGRLDRLPRLS